MRSSLRLLRVLRDGDVIAEARQDAALVVEADPTFDDHPVLSHAIDVLVGSEREEYLERG
jgi:ATP-dependent DNA helicase RecG